MGKLNRKGSVFFIEGATLTFITRRYQDSANIAVKKTCSYESNCILR
jgi:hypothetical protein